MKARSNISLASVLVFVSILIGCAQPREPQRAKATERTQEIAFSIVSNLSALLAPEDFEIDLDLSESAHALLHGDEFDAEVVSNTAYGHWRRLRLDLSTLKGKKTGEENLASVLRDHGIIELSILVDLDSMSGLSPTYETLSEAAWVGGRIQFALEDLIVGAPKPNTSKAERKVVSASSNSNKAFATPAQSFAQSAVATRPSCPPRHFPRLEPTGKVICIFMQDPPTMQCKNYDGAIDTSLFCVGSNSNGTTFNGCCAPNEMCMKGKERTSCVPLEKGECEVGARGPAKYHHIPRGCLQKVCVATEKGGKWENRDVGFDKCDRPFTLTVKVEGPGRVRDPSHETAIVPTGNRIDCPDKQCTAEYIVSHADGRGNGRGSLEAIPDAGAYFLGWEGCGSDSVDPLDKGCSFRVPDDSHLAVTAKFGNVGYALSVQVSGSGHGRVSSSPDGIACGKSSSPVKFEKCSYTYPQNQVVKLSAHAEKNSRFMGWGGECSGSDPCEVTMSAAKNVTAKFDHEIVTVKVIIKGEGTVTGKGIECRGDCEEELNPQTWALELKPVPADGWKLGLMTGCSTVYGGYPTNSPRSCDLELNDAHEFAEPTPGQAKTTWTVYFHFFRADYQVRVSKTGSGSGTVVSSNHNESVAPHYIDCGNRCRDRFKVGTSVVLKAIVQKGSKFTGWSGACEGSEKTCTIEKNPIEVELEVTAKFETEPPPISKLTVQVNGPGRVDVSSAKFDQIVGHCENPNTTWQFSFRECTFLVVSGGDYKLKATAFEGTTLKSFSGSSAVGEGSEITKTVDTDTTVSATFEFLPINMTIESRSERGGSGTYAVWVNGSNRGTSPGELKVGDQVFIETKVNKPAFDYASITCSPQASCFEASASKTIVPSDNGKVVTILYSNVRTLMTK